ncbi:DUF397 domain-containing protein [Streptomyces sp. NPDC058611]|uniref:DUF397 domain-containing protein n=1 Tax=unclassified Streptomyces TaxID=2593676 RepID=UPI00365CF1EA
MHPVSPAIDSAIWIKSSYSGAEHSECVEAALLADATAVRDSKRPTGRTISFTHPVWHAFLKGLNSGV